MIGRTLIALTLFAAVLLPAGSAAASQPESCETEPSPACFALESVAASLSTHQAGAHPDFFTSFGETTDPGSKANSFGLKRPYAVTRDVEIDLPPGLIGNPNAVEQCTLAELETFNLEGGGCPNGSQVGIAKVYAYFLPIAFTEPVYMMSPPADGSSIARLGFIAGIAPTIVQARLRQGSDYGVTAIVEAANGQQELVKTETTLWGVPAAPIHDTQRQTPVEAFHGAASSPSRPPGGPPKPFMSNPTRCGVPLEVGFGVDSYQEPGRFSRMSAPLGEITGCDQLSFSPGFSVDPTGPAAGEPTGLDAELRLPQNEAVGALATSELRYARVVLPEGMTIAAGAGDGLAACSAEQVAQIPAACPPAAKIGDAEFESPALSRTLRGSVYQRTPVKGDLFGIWLVADELGVHLKLPGEIHLDSQTGRITSSFEGTAASEGNPQLPLTDFRLHFKSGPRAPLAAPRACGTYETEYELVPWSGRPPVRGQTPMSFDQNCAAPGFSPKLSAGSTNPLAGAFSPFLTTLTIGSGEQNLSGLDVTLPSGVLARLAGVPVCDEAAAAAGSCAPGSQVGSATVAAGPGPSPLWLPQPGKEPIPVFLAGPYKGAPYSLVVRTPAQAGPFDLGTVITRAGIYVDPATAQATVKSDPLPQILEGVPVTYRTLHIAVDRPEFTLNPTSCAEKQVSATATSILGTSATASARFAVGGCGELDYGPKLSLRLKGATRRSGDPALKAVLTQPAHQANTRGATVILPSSEFIDQAHINNPCTRVQFAAGACPPGSVLGTATAVSPLLDQPLRGPVYFRSNGGERDLPDIVADLHGQIHIVLVGFIDSVQKKGTEISRVRTRFASVPDAPVTRFTMSLYGGKRGLIENHVNLCGAPHRAELRLTAQNGKRERTRPLVRVGCGGGKPR
jgi:hypothetical protein